MKYNIEFFFYLLILLLIIEGVFLMKESFLGGRKNIVRHQMSLKRGAKRIITDLKDSGTDEIFVNAGIKLSVKKYMAIRNLALLLLFCMAALSLLSGDLRGGSRLVLILAAGFLLSYPKSMVRGKKTPFKMVLDVMYKNRQDRKDEELFSVVSQMKNVILAHNASAVSSDYLFTKLLRFTNISKPIFLKTQNLIIMGRKDEAGKFFSEAYGTKFGKDFSRIIPKLDELHPKEFLDQLILFQNNMRELYQTKKENRQNRNMLIMTALSTLELTIFMLNFMYLVFVDTLQYMKF